MELKRITPEEARQLLESNQDYVYLDVRTVAEFDAGHVPGARNVPLLEPDASGRMQPNPKFLETVQQNFPGDTRIITGCKMGGRSMKAAALLLSSGFQNVLDMRGGFDGERDPGGTLSFPGWAPRGLPVTQESAPADRYENLAKK
jgi:rhodanese-related sulfurtransferase